MAVYVRKLFGIGKLPADLRAEIEAEEPFYLAEYVAVTRRFSGAIPGLRASHTVGSFVGSLAFTPERVLATLSVVPRLAGRMIDVRWDRAQTGAATAEISPTGLQLDLDVAQVDPKFSGQLSLHYKDAIPHDVLDRLPSRSLAFDMPPEYVFRAVGVTFSP
ncbi:hypothetical protein A5791_03290 [Mycobacterium sp. 852002-51163_SCH5372311]|uniref:hypothetical protein n=1 Tax=Mycobacterium sp. 852002-51163_SCH5372311 TaxID=1834097 RepID=UPI0007FE2583|nr:hypothetical protein [Mycobacterium sp. 852002-51163_SCH5372311]OBF83588.1 hypothetical protein A5791_03290 [Mycobacterium sp. 852002-51163_SCH5372311]